MFGGVVGVSWRSRMRPVMRVIRCLVGVIRLLRSRRDVLGRWFVGVVGVVMVRCLLILMMRLGGLRVVRLRVSCWFVLCLRARRLLMFLVIRSLVMILRDWLVRRGTFILRIIRFLRGWGRRMLVRCLGIGCLMLLIFGIRLLSWLMVFILVVPSLFRLFACIRLLVDVVSMYSLIISLRRIDDS